MAALAVLTASGFDFAVAAFLHSHLNKIYYLNQGDRCTSSYSCEEVAAAVAAAAAAKQVFIYKNYNIKSNVNVNTQCFHVIPHALHLQMGSSAIKTPYLILPRAIPAHVE